jgi:glycosyltransferase involved in cell wall biosynthesis
MSIGAVLIGRNEGARLVAALEAAQGQVGRMVYVDSGSTDGSVEAARRAGAAIVDLDLSIPFTAARARNEGLARLLQDGPLDYVQFIDGDCALQPGWIDTAQAFLDENPQAAVVHGRRRERYPEATVYNQLCDWEWDVPPGPVKACGGDAMMRVAAFQAVGGYDPGPDRGRRAGVVRPPARGGLADPVSRCRDDASRRGHDALWPVLETRAAGGPCLCRGGRDARGPA